MPTMEDLFKFEPEQPLRNGFQEAKVKLNDTGIPKQHNAVLSKNGEQSFQAKKYQMLVWKGDIGLWCTKHVQSVHASPRDQTCCIAPTSRPLVAARIGSTGQAEGKSEIRFNTKEAYG